MKKYLIFLILFSSFSCENDTPDPIPNPNPIEYSLTLNISPDGGGTLSKSSGVFNENETVSVLATANENYNFDGWTGSVISNNNPLSITMDSDKIITANFSEIELCEIDYSLLQTGINTQTSHYQPMNIPFIDYASKLGINLPPNQFTVWFASGNFNGNNTPDYIMAPSDWKNPSGNQIVIVKDGILSHTFTNPQTFTRKISVIDLNQDMIDDIVLFGQGEDIPNSPGDKTVVIYMYPDGNYKVSEIGLNSGYIHSGAVGAINGGLNDIIEINALGFISNPNGFVEFYSNSGINELWVQGETNIPTHHVARSYQSELYDFDNDGKLDLILGGHEWKDDWMDSSPKPVQWRTHILKGLGNGQFDIDNPILLPVIPNWGVITDFDMYDIDNDGNTEIIITRTTGSKGAPLLPADNTFYDGILYQILKGNDNSWYEWKKVEQPSSVFDTPNVMSIWATNTYIYDVNKDCLLDIIPQSDKINAFTWTEWSFIRGLYFEQQTNGNFLIKYKE